MADPRDFYLTTEYPIDNIVYLAEGSVSTPNGTSDFITVGSHGLPFTPLVMLVWSNDADFTVSNYFIDTALATSWFTSFAGQAYIGYANATDVFIQRDNTSGSTKTLYYRIYCFAPSDAPIDSIVPATADDGDPFAFNTQYNYLKLLHAGKLTPGSPAYTHGLGYVPRAFKWGKVGNIYQSPMQMFQYSGDPTGSLGISTGVYIDENEIRWMNPNTFDEIEFRLYVDS